MWVEFTNHLEITDLTKDECDTQGPNGKRLIWAIPDTYRAPDFQRLQGSNTEDWKRCLVALDPPDCKPAPRTRINHLGNTEGVASAPYKWTRPHFPSDQEQRCVLRIRLVEFAHYKLLLGQFQLKII